MKTLKKLSCIALILVLALAMAAPAFAAGNNGSITVTNPQANESYSIYKLFDLSYGGTGVEDESNEPEVSGSEDPHSYTIATTSLWYDFVRPAQEKTDETEAVEAGIGAAYVTVDAEGYVTWKTGAEAAAFAQEAMKYAKEKGIEPLRTITAAEATEANPNPVVKFEGLELGYYLIDSSLGALCALDSTNYNANIREKNELPSLTKKVLDGEDYGESTTASYGGTVTFKIDVTIPETAAGEIVVHDTMDAALDYVALTDDSFDVTVANGEDCTKEFTISAEQVAENKPGTVSIIYTATLGADAETNTEIVNEAYLTYSKYTSKPDDAKVFTYEFDLFKTNSKNVPLDGATFSLGMDLVNLGNNTYRVAVAGDETTVTEFTTDATGKILIKGLANGTYTLTEVSAPEGYNKLKAPVEVVIANANNIVTEDAEAENGYTGTHIINLTGAELPSTGGIGTTIFYIVGGLLVVGACVLLVTRKRVDG